MPSLYPDIRADLLGSGGICLRSANAASGDGRRRNYRRWRPSRRPGHDQQRLYREYSLGPGHQSHYPYQLGGRRCQAGSAGRRSRAARWTPRCWPITATGIKHETDSNALRPTIWARDMLLARQHPMQADTALLKTLVGNFGAKRALIYKEQFGILRQCRRPGDEAVDALVGNRLCGQWMTIRRKIELRKDSRGQITALYLVHDDGFRAGVPANAVMGEGRGDAGACRTRGHDEVRRRRTGDSAGPAGGRRNRGPERPV